MKGISINKDYFSSVGMSRSESTEMVAIDDTIAYQYSSYSSPDGRSFKYGFIPDEDYLLPEEITLEEYDHTSCNEYGRGQYNICKIEELKNVFIVRYSSSRQEDVKIFLVGIRETEIPLLKLDVKIYPVRRREGKFLHIYIIPLEMIECLGESFDFDETVENLKSFLLEEEKRIQEVVSKKYRDIDISYYVNGNGYYPPKLYLYPEDRGSENHKIKVSSKCPKGRYKVYLFDYPINVNVYEDEITINICYGSSIWDQKKWWFTEHRCTSLKPGWIFLDGKDVYGHTQVMIIREKIKRKKYYEEHKEYYKARDEERRKEEEEREKEEAPLRIKEGFTIEEIIRK